MVAKKTTETELKLRCTDPSVWENIMISKSLSEIAVPGSEHIENLDAHYFDTPSYCLQKAKLAYRVRREGEKWIATVKGGGSSAGGLHERREWNVVVSDCEPNIGVFHDTAVGMQLAQVVGSEILSPIVITRFERRKLDVIMPDGSQIEVAADQGEIIAGESTAPILEVELELKSGQPASLLRLGAILAREYSLLPDPDSKFYRGLILAGLVDRSSETVNPLLQINKKNVANQEFRTILIQLIAQVLLAQQNFIANPALPEHIHELRVCLRRLRSILEFAEPLFMCDQYKSYQAELRKVGQMLAGIREMDVAYASWQEVVDNWPSSSKSNELGKLLFKRRQWEEKNIYQMFKNGYTTPLLLDLWATLITVNSEELIGGNITVREYAIRNLSIWLMVALKQGKTIDWTIAEDVHKLRLTIKKIKYIAEVMKSLFYEVDPLILRLHTLQNGLGLVQDVDSTNKLLQLLITKRSSKILHLESGMLMGWQRREEVFIKSKIDKYWKKFHRIAERWI